MNIDVTEHIVRIVVVAPRDRVDAFTAPALRQHMDRLLAEGARYFVVDLSSVPFLDSAGMAVLVSLLKRARQADGDVKLVWPVAEAAKRVLRLTKFDRVFAMHETADTAIKDF